MWKGAHLRHSLLNLGGAAIPILIGLPCLGVLARTLGPGSLSVFLLILALVGYAGVLDMGISRAVVALVAERADDREARLRVLSTALLTVSAVGVAVSLLLLVAAGPLVTGVLGLDGPDALDAIAGFRLTALTILPLLIFLCAQGYLDGTQQFAEANLQRAITGSLPILTATVAAVISVSVAGTMAGFLVGRLISLAVVMIRRDFWRLLSIRMLDRETLHRLVGFGSWVTVSGIVSPVMGYLDRFILAAARGSAVVSFYAAPAEAVFRLLVIPTAITRSLFPKLSQPADHAARRDVIRQTYVMLLVASLPAVAIGLIWAPQILDLWLGPDFRQGSTTVLRILMVGFLAGGLAQIPLTRLLAASRPDTVAILHLCQLLPFLAIAYQLGLVYGAAGAAAAWSLRNIIDLALLSFFARRQAPL